jgi:predicted ATPase/class 3 adenylate cyclase/Tfp pilus assembly protein PilF
MSVLQKSRPASKRDFPSGTVTFLFTDVEGSTRRWEQDSQATRDAIERHFALLDEAIEANHGVRFKTIGDAIQAAFPTAPDALLAAISAQRALVAADWGGFAPLSVRMALHTGAATPADGDYLAPALNRLSRLLAAGAGGQILITEATHHLLRDSLPGDVSLQDLGSHRLRDLREAEPVYQVNASGLPVSFPPLKTIDRQTNNLPAQLTEFIGREGEVEEARRLLAQPGVRLLTLTGPGGTGKTRLALRVAADVLQEYDDGVWFVAVAPISSAGLVAPAIAEALGLREVPDEPALETLRAYLRPKHLLLVLDNFEHVIDAAPVVADLLTNCPALQILVTSRAPLRIAGEHELPVPPLSLPDANDGLQLEEILASEAVRLFVDRARVVRRDFVVTERNARTIASICRRLDGLPLAIELAAARVRLLSPEAILSRLDSRLTLLTGGGRDRPERQQTLRAAIAWSHDLLAEDEQVLLRRLAVFIGGWSLDEAEAIVNAVDAPEISVIDGLTSLSDNSLIGQTDSVGVDDVIEPRFFMLQTIREFALEQLAASGERDAVKTAHAEHFLSLTVEAEPHLIGSDAVPWLDRLESEHGNLRASLAWFAERGERVSAVRLAGALWRFWWVRGHIGEGREQLERALGIEGAMDAASEAMALDGAGVLAETQGDYARSAALHEKALALSRENRDSAGIARALGNLGVLAYDQRDDDRAAALLEESLTLARDAGDQITTATALNDLGFVVHRQGDSIRAEGLFRESLALRRVIGNASEIARSLNNLGTVAFDQGNFTMACELYEESLALYQETGDKWGAAGAMTNLSEALRHQGDTTRATALLEESLSLYQETGDARNAAVVLLNLAAIARERQELETAAAKFREALAQSQTVDDHAGVSDALAGLGGVLAVQGRYEEAARLLGAAVSPSAGTESQALSDADRFQADLNQVRGALAPTAFASEWNAGQRLTLDAAISAARSITNR